MVNLKSKMYQTNAKIKSFLINKGFIYMYFMPHLRFLKDYHFAGCEFDAIGWKKDDKRIYLFQFKTNKICSRCIVLRWWYLANRNILV